MPSATALEQLRRLGTVFRSKDAVSAGVSWRAWVGWDPKPTVDDAEQTVVATATGEWDEAAAGEWLRARLDPPSPA
jgi:hypothetical protein